MYCAVLLYGEGRFDEKKTFTESGCSSVRTSCLLACDSDNKQQKIALLSFKPLYKRFHYAALRESIVLTVSVKKTAVSDTKYTRSRLSTMPRDTDVKWLPADR